MEVLMKRYVFLIALCVAALLCAGALADPCAPGHHDTDGVGWTFISAATCTDGEIHGKYCRICGELAETTEFFALGHNWSSETQGDTEVWTCDRCGGVCTHTADDTWTISMPVVGGDRVPWNSENTKKVVISEGCTRIRRYAFSGCESMTDVTLPGSLKRIEKQAFDYCEALTRINIPAGIEFIAEDAFRYCTALDQAAVLAGSPVRTVIDGVVFSKDGTRLLHYPPTRAGASYTVPAGVKEIVRDAFGDVIQLKEIVFPESLETIEEFAFYNCGFTELRFPASLRLMPGDAFDVCPELTSIVLPDGPCEFYGSVFRECPKLVSVTVPNGLTMNGGTFFACENLREFIVSADHPTMEFRDGALINKTTGTMVLCAPAVMGRDYTVPEGVKAIGSYAIHSLWLARLTFPETVETLHDITVEQTPFLREVVLPRSLKDFGRYYIASNDENITFYCYRDSAAHQWLAERGLRYVLLDEQPAPAAPAMIVLPADVKTVADSAFAGTDADVYILPEGTLRIGSRAFSGLKKQGVRIFLPTSIVEIADDAFADSDVTAVLAGSAYVYEYCEEHNIPTESAYDWGGDG